MYLEIVSPEAKLFSGEVQSVTVPGAVGSFQMLNNHAPIVSTLKKGNVIISGNIEIDDLFKDMFRFEEPNITILKINSGTVEMSNNKLIILAD